MKKVATSLLTLILITSAGFSQNVQVDIKNEMKHLLAMEMPMDLNLEFDFPMELDVQMDIPANFHFDSEISENYFHVNGNWRDDFAGDPRIERFRKVLAKNEYTSETQVVIKNINGELKVTGYDGDDIVIEGTKELRKKRGEVSDEEAADFELKTRLYEGKLYLYIDSPYAQVEFKNGEMKYHWNENKRSKIKAHFDLEIQLPEQLVLNAATVNNGNVSIEKMQNDVHAANINGSVVVKDVRGYTTASTVNGNIEVWYSESPVKDTEFKTVNGTIEIYSPEDLSAIVTFESLHGELYSDFEQIKRLPNRLNKEKDGDGFRYKINSKSPIQIGDGAIEMGFKLVNGNVYIRTRKS